MHHFSQSWKVYATKQGAPYSGEKKKGFPGRHWRGLREDGWAAHLEGYQATGQQTELLGECPPGKHRNDTLLDVLGCFMFYGPAKEFAKKCNQSQRKIADEKLNSRDNQGVTREWSRSSYPHSFVVSNIYKGETMYIPNTDSHSDCDRLRGVCECVWGRWGEASVAGMLNPYLQQE